MKKNKWDGLDILLISVATFLAVSMIGVAIERFFGYEEYKPITYVV